jgi:hypothetical protein
MKTSLDIPEALLRKTKAAAALRGQTMKEFVAAALEEKLRRLEDRNASARPVGWRAVFGRARREHVRELDRIVREEFSRVEPQSWR